MHDYDRELVGSMLADILWAIDQIQKRFKGIDTPSNFSDNDVGLEKLDSICMQLINIGETLKGIDKSSRPTSFAKPPTKNIAYKMWRILYHNLSS